MDYRPDLSQIKNPTPSLEGVGLFLKLTFILHFELEVIGKSTHHAKDVLVGLSRVQTNGRL